MENQIKEKLLERLRPGLQDGNISKKRRKISASYTTVPPAGDPETRTCHALRLGKLSLADFSCQRQCKINATHLDGSQGPTLATRTAKNTRSPESSKYPASPT